MPLTEFGLIDRYFQQIGPRRESTVLGVGDDCAVLRPPGDELLLVSTDTLVENIHFRADVDAESLGHKALAVNLSDLAAMGAKPLWATLALTLPRVNEAWLEAFALGFSKLASRHAIQLVGGDTTQGPLSITVQAIGSAVSERILYRSAARPGDRIYLSGNIGDAGLALKLLETEAHCPSELRERLERPEPRIRLGQLIAGLAHACIDISDGLIADLGHVLQASRVGATVDWDALPLSRAVRDYVESSRDHRLPLCAGDDYELCFTVSRQHEAELLRQIALLNETCHRIGIIDERPGLRIENCDANLSLGAGGFQHFAEFAVRQG